MLSPKTRAPTRPGTAKRRNAKPNLLIHEAQQGCRDATYEPSRFPVAVPYPSPHRATPAYVVVTSSDLDTSRNKASVSGLSWISRKPNAVNRLGICYSRACRLDADQRGNTLIRFDSRGSNGDAEQHSRARLVDPSQSSRINGLPRRSAPNPCADQQKSAHCSVRPLSAPFNWNARDSWLRRCRWSVALRLRGCHFWSRWRNWATVRCQLAPWWHAASRSGSATYRTP